MSHLHENVEDETFNDFMEMETSIKCEIMSECNVKMEILDGSYETDQEVNGLMSIKEEKNEYLYCTEIEDNQITYNKHLSPCKYILKMESKSNDYSTLCSRSDSCSTESTDNLLNPTVGKVLLGTKKSRTREKPSQKFSPKNSGTQIKKKRKKRKVNKKDDVTYACGFCFKTFDNCKVFFSHMALHGDKPRKQRNIKKEKCEKIKTNESLSKSRKGKNEKKHKIKKEEESSQSCFKTEISKQKSNLIECDNKKIHQCDECGQTFTFKQNLLRHKMKHAGVRYICDFCKKDYNCKSYLVQHINVMHLKNSLNDTVFKCTICKKTVNTAYALRWHMQTHTGLKPFKCDICMKGFSNKWNLKIHVKNWHK